MLRGWAHVGASGGGSKPGQHVLCIQGSRWHGLLGALGAQFGLRMPLPELRIAIKGSMERVLTHLINKVTCFAGNVTKDFEEDCAMDYNPKGWTFSL